MLLRQRIAASVFLLFSANCFAQVDRAALTGSVTDSTGAALAGAAVVAESPATGFRREAITTEFTTVARELQAAIAPVGLAWTMARLERPDWRRYMSDGGHPTATGSYLAGLVICTTIRGKKCGSWVIDLPASTRGPEWPSGTEVALVYVTWSDKMALSSIAARASVEHPFKAVRTTGSGAPAR